MENQSSNFAHLFSTHVATNFDRFINLNDEHMDADLDSLMAASVYIYLKKNNNKNKTIQERAIVLQ